MIRLPEARLDESERYALETLIDLSRVLPFVGADPHAVTQVVITDTAPEAVSLRSCVAHRWFIAPGDGEVRIPRDALALITDIAGAAAEQRSEERDRHGRVPASANPLVALGLEREPVISQAAIAFRNAVVAAAGRRAVRVVAPWPDGKRWAACLTHDVDVVDWWPVFTALRVSELLKKGQARRVGHVLAAAARAIGASPVMQGLRECLAAEQGGSLPSTWFFICGDPTLTSMRAGDVTYDPGAEGAHRFFGALRASHEIGLHGSFATFESGSAMGSQRTRLEALSGRAVRGARQHYLRMRPGLTQRAMVDAGLEYDATYGFADRNGFRLGVADVVFAWDGETARRLQLAEVPLVWMDRAQSKYQNNENPSAWVDEALSLAASCREVDGLWVSLWHPNLTAPLGFPGAAAAYRRLIDATLENDPFLGTMTEIVEWRSARRSLRSTAIDATGAPVLTDVGRRIELQSV